MDKEVYNWRKKHPKCIYCIYCRTRRFGIEQIVADECVAKDTIILFSSIPRWFCKLYKVRE